MTIVNNYTAGDEVDSKCLKCKAATNHTIIAMVEDTIAKVECNVCKARHNYRPIVTKVKKVQRKAAKAKGPRKVSSVKKNKALLIYQNLIDGRDLATAIPYTISSSFKETDLINHPTFGIGYVVDIVMPNKVEIVFPEGPKLFICAKHEM